MTFYAIQAQSRKLGKIQRFLDEDEMRGRKTTNAGLAQQKAEAFAARLNQQQLAGATDWQARIELIDSPFKSL